MWRAQLHRRKPRPAQRENTSAGGSCWMGTMQLPETQPAGRGPLGSASVFLWPGQGCGSASVCSFRTGVAGLEEGKTAGDKGMEGGMALMGESSNPIGVFGVGSHDSSPAACPQWLCSCSRAARAAELHKAVPTKTMLLLPHIFYFNLVNWHSSALQDQPWRLSMLSFLELKGGVNGLTQESWSPWPRGMYCL